MNVWIFSADEPTVPLRGALREAGHATFGVYLAEIAGGDVDLHAVYRALPPDLLLVEVSPPTAAAWRVAQVLRSSEAFGDCAIVWLTSDPERLATAVGFAEDNEVVLRSDDVATILEVVQVLTGDDAEADEDGEEPRSAA